MKKLLCVFMAVMMLFSSVAVIGASAADGYAVKNPITDSFDSYEEFVEENADKEIYGFTYKFLYEERGWIDWSKLAIYFEKDGVPTQSTRGSVSLGFSNINNHFKRLMTNFFGGSKLHTEEYATDIANFVGKLVHPEFEEVVVTFPGGVTPNEDDFYKFIADNSGLIPIIQTNWIDQGIDFKVFLKAFGVDLTSIVSHKYSDARTVAAALIKGAVNYMMAYGPLEAMYKVLDSFTSGFYALQESTRALFALKINAGKRTGGTDIYGQPNRRFYTADELDSMEGLLTYVFDGAMEYEFFKFPKAKMVDYEDEDKPERMLCLMMYFAINYRYKNNADVVNNIVRKLNDFIYNGNRYKTAGYSKEEIDVVSEKFDEMINVIFKGDLTVDGAVMIGALTQEHLDQASNDILTQLKNWLEKMIRKITDYFDYVFKVLTGEHQYGQPMN